MAAETNLDDYSNSPNLSKQSVIVGQSIIVGLY